MTFDEFKGQNIQYWMDHPALCATARMVWDAATAAERQRCREIAQAYRQHYNAFGRNVALAIEGEIGGD